MQKVYLSSKIVVDNEAAKFLISVFE